MESSERTISGTVILLPVRFEDSSEALPQTVETVAQFGKLDSKSHVSTSKDHAPYSLSGPHTGYRACEIGRAHV